MRKIFGGILLAIGAFLLVAAALGTFWAPGVVKKTPIDVNTLTKLSGEAARLDTATGDFTTRPIWASSLSQVDSKSSTDDVDLFVATSCAQFDTGQEQVCDADTSNPAQITIDVDTFAVDRVSALSVDSSKLPADAVPHEGLVNKWPFDAAKKTYPYWDSTTAQAFDAVYDSTKTIGGLETYVYKVSISDAPIEIGPDIAGTYTDSKLLYVDPRTGSIINQVDDQQRYLADGTQVLDLKVAFTDAQVAFNVKDTKDSIKSLDLVTKTIPVVGLVGGILFLAVGALLVRRRKPGGHETTADEREPVGAGR